MVTEPDPKTKSSSVAAVLNDSDNSRLTVLSSANTGQAPDWQNMRAVTPRRTVPAPSPTSLRSKVRLIRSGVDPAASLMASVTGATFRPPVAVPETTSDSRPSTARSDWGVTTNSTCRSAG